MEFKRKNRFHSNTFILLRCINQLPPSFSAPYPSIIVLTRTLQTIILVRPLLCLQFNRQSSNVRNNIVSSYYRTYTYDDFVQYTQAQVYTTPILVMGTFPQWRFQDFILECAITITLFISLRFSVIHCDITMPFFSLFALFLVSISI